MYVHVPWREPFRSAMAANKYFYYMRDSRLVRLMKYYVGCEIRESVVRPQTEKEAYDPQFVSSVMLTGTYPVKG